MSKLMYGALGSFGVVWGRCFSKGDIGEAVVDMGMENGRKIWYDGDRAG